MALERLQGRVYRWYIASPLAFADWRDPQLDELNANPTNDPNGLIWNLSCALNVDGSTFDIADSELDDSLTFCQEAGDTSVTSRNAEVVFESERSSVPWVGAAATVPNGFNSANLAFSLLAWRGIEYFAILSIGEEPEDPFADGDELYIARVVTDHGGDEMGTGENIRLSQNFAFRGDVAKLRVEA